MHAPKTLGDRGAIARPAPSCINQTISITCLLCRLRSAAFAITMSPRSNISAANVPTCAFHPVTGRVFSEEFRGYGRFTNTTLSLSLCLFVSLCARVSHTKCVAHSLSMDDATHDGNSTGPRSIPGQETRLAG